MSVCGRLPRVSGDRAMLTGNRDHQVRRDGKSHTVHGRLFAQIRGMGLAEGTPLRPVGKPLVAVIYILVCGVREHRGYLGAFEDRTSIIILTR